MMFPNAPAVINPPAKGGEKPDPEEGKQEFADGTSELHPESHPLILDKQDLEPITYHVDMLANLHVSFHHDLDDLVNHHKENSQQKKLFAF